MADSEVQIVNYALTLLGKDRINSLSEDLEAARSANAVYGLVRDACLVEHGWGFAITRAACGLLSDAPEFEWTSAFQLPTDCLRVLDTDLSTGTNYKIEGRTIVCDAESLEIKYIKQVTDTTVFSPMFTKYFATRLAEELAFPLTGSRSLEADLYAKAEKIKANAFGLDSIEGTPDQPLQDDWRSARS